MLALGRDTLAWSTRDGGVTWAPVQVSRELYITDVGFHPTISTWLFARTVRDTCFTASPSDVCSYELRVSRDLGATWALVTTHATRPTWSVSARPSL